MEKKSLSERDICTKFITPALRSAGWDEMLQIREEVSFTAGRIIVRGKLMEQDAAEGTGADLSRELLKLRSAAQSGRRGRPAVEEQQITQEDEYLIIPQSWAWVRLHEIGMTQTGTSPSSSNTDLFGDFIPFVKPADLDGASINCDGPGGAGHRHARREGGC